MMRWAIGVGGVVDADVNLLMGSPPALLPKVSIVRCRPSHLSQLLSLILHFIIVMDPDQSPKFPLHEAAREGKSMYC